MYAIVEIQGNQVKVEKGEQVNVPLLKEDMGAQVSIEKVLLVNTDSGVKIGKPYVKGATVLASVVRHDRDKKVIVFKKKRRKGYKVKKGHRQPFTVLRIEEIKATKPRKKSTKKAETPEEPQSTTEE